VVDSAGNCAGGGACWHDGSVHAYDAISQFVSTRVGDQYKLSCMVAESSGPSAYQALSTNGDVFDTNGNGVDVLAYALAGLPVGAFGAPPLGALGPTPGAGLASSAFLLAAARFGRRFGPRA